MDRISRRAAWGALALCLPLLGSPPPLRAQTRTAEAAVAAWPDAPRGLVQVLTDKYGEPDRIDDDAAVWYDNGHWKKTVVYRTALYGEAGAARRCHLEQTIDYLVPRDKEAEIGRFDQRVVVDRVSGELSACSDSEGLNYLALNLADDIVSSRRTAAGARDFYDKVRELAAAGKSSAYTEHFLFTPGKAGLIYPESDHTGYEP